jgi:acetyltransferase-like isoleucine patch superfamily enzyme
MKIRKKLSRLYNFLVQIIYPLFLKLDKNIILNGKIILKGLPIIETKYDAIIEFGNNVMLNSCNWGYHINMFAPVKLYCNRKKAKIYIGDNTKIYGTCIHAIHNIHIGKNCLIAANCQLIDSHGHDLSFDNVENRIHTEGDESMGAIIIEDNVWIAANSMILPGSKIGNGSIIVTGSVVRSEIPPLCVAAGNPARVVRRFNDVQNRKNDLRK